MFDTFKKHDKIWCGVAGAVIALIGKEILKAKKTRELAVSGLAKGMKLQNDAKAVLQSMKDEANDICYDARQEAQVCNDEKEAE